MRTLRAALALLTAVCGGCASLPDGPAESTISARLNDHLAGDSVLSGASSAPLPPGAAVEDGVSRDEAVAIALWRNHQFRADLADLGIARADIVDAGVLANPVLSLLFPWGPKQLEATVRWPLQALLQRPRRVAAARLAADVVGERLVDHGLTLAADVKIAHTELAAAVERVQLARETAALIRQISTITQARLRAGDISAFEARIVETDALRADEEAALASRAVAVRHIELVALLGLDPVQTRLEVPPLARAAASANVCGELADLMKDALAARPDARAAELDVEAAGARAGWERSRVYTLVGVLDANGSGAEGFEAGPGLEAELVSLNRNQGGRARANADLERASRYYLAVLARVSAELTIAHIAFAHTRDLARSWNEQLIPALEREVRDAERAFAAGDIAYLFVLENTRRLADARARELEARAEVYRAAAQVDRSVGRTCVSGL